MVGIGDPQFVVFSSGIPNFGGEFLEEVNEVVGELGSQILSNPIS